MKIGILGSGMVGQALGTRLLALGHDVMIATRQPEKLAAWQTESGGQVGSAAEAAAYGELIINATRGDASLAVLEQAGAAHLDGKVLIDIANPLDFSQGMPPTLWVKDTDSLGEQIQRAFPQVRVVKALNTMNAALMVNPDQLAGGEHTVFISGNDEAAKAQVAELLRSFGWRDILDLGDISTARGTEMLLPLWVRLWGRLGNVPFQFKIVR